MPQWLLSLSKGLLTDGTREISVYSGAVGPYKNNSDYCDVADYGPIPLGIWNMGIARNDDKLGPTIIPLTPDDETVTYGRSAFYIHGDSKSHPGCASEGCIVTDGSNPADDRTYLAASPYKQILVEP